MISEQQAKQLVREVVEAIADDLENQGILEKNQSYYMIDALRWISYQKFADNMPAVAILKIAILSVAAGLNKYNSSLPPMYAKGAMSKAKGLCVDKLQQQYGLTVNEVTESDSRK